MVLTRNPAIFGRDVKLFRSERFLFLEPGCDEAQRSYRINSLQMVFGGGEADLLREACGHV